MTGSLWGFSPNDKENAQVPQAPGGLLYLQAKKSPCGRFLEVLCAKRGKLLTAKVT
jgi:hypothetical protein